MTCGALCILSEIPKESIALHSGEKACIAGFQMSFVSLNATLNFLCIFLCGQFFRTNTTVDKRFADAAIFMAMR